MKKSLVALFITCAVAVVAIAQKPSESPRQAPRPADPHAGHKTDAPPAKDVSPAQKYFSDVKLVDQDGKTHRFYSDMLKGKTVIVNAFFTTCTGVCPPMNRNLEMVQQALGDRLGRDVFIVSISVDPVTTRVALEIYAQPSMRNPAGLF